MDWSSIGGRIRRQREFLGYTREQFAELLDVTPKFCADIELGVKGMSVQTLCRISEILRLSTDFILFGKENSGGSTPIVQLLRSCCAEHVKVKAAGGIKTLADAEDFIELGADRLGTSRIVKLAMELENAGGAPQENY